jgi:hypothetical protein
VVFLGALITPAGNDWVAAFSNLFAGGGWPLDTSSLIAKITFADLEAQIIANPENAAALEEKKMYSGFARLQLLLLFLGICAIVWYSTVKRKKATL